jgi:hypothetical protein
MTKTADPETGEVLEGRHIRPFAEWLHEQRDGALVLELGEALNDLVETVNILAKGGSLTLKVTIKPSSRGNSAIVLVTDEVSVKKPEPEPEPAVFFVDGNANLSRANPSQPSLPLREVPARSDTLKEAQK